MNLILLKSLSKETFITWCFSMIIIVVLSVVSNANADSDIKLPTAVEIFSKAVEAESTVDYVGKQIIIRWHPFGSIAVEERVIHQVPSTHIIELLIPIDMGDRNERNRMRRMLPPPTPRKLQDIWETDNQLLLRNYTVDVALDEPIAGKSTYLLSINPKVVSRPKKKVWLDAQYYIILRMENYDIKGKLSSLIVYTTIDYDRTSVAQKLKRYQEEQSEREQERESNRARPYRSEETSFAEAEKQFGGKLPQPSYLPAGFQLQSISVMTFRGKRIHFQYTDGLTALSLFVSKANAERQDRQNRRPPDDSFRDRRGRGNRFRGGKPTTITVKNIPIFVINQGQFRILRWELNKQSEQEKLHFVLIGELSQEEMLKMAETLVSQG